ncbi:MAG: hypothetical protein CBD44_03560 [Flavobacteriaceae bacterium TMED184]|nr:MAG: hypothetical protein CBD44_03560 [Flavobacteriaceae bacterium TMED184]
MLIKQYIKELLYIHECVTIPSFGAFLTQSTRAFVNYEVGNFEPPKKIIGFNILLKNNDGVLANHLAKKEKISYEKALKKIEKEVIIWKQRLNTQNLFFPGIGEMKLTYDKKIEFFPSRQINFDSNSFGLKPFQRNLIKKIIPVSDNKNLFHMDNQTKDDLMFTPEEKKSQNPFLRYAAIAILTIALLGTSYYYGDKYMTEEKIEATKIAQKKIKDNVLNATFDLGTISKIELNFDAENNYIQPVAEYNFYSIIAGSFRSMSNAEKKLSTLIEEGYNAEYSKSSPEGLYRVAYGRFESKKEALKLLNFIRYTLEEEAWYLEE